jgi:hypothetical protein
MKVCAYCGKKILLIHGNRKYCNHKCYYEMKKYRNQESYSKKRDTIDEITTTERALKMLYEMFGNSLIDEFYYSKLNINWDVKTGVLEHNNESYELVGSFGYIIYNNRKIKIINYGNNDF